MDIHLRLHLKDIFVAEDVALLFAQMTLLLLLHHEVKLNLVKLKHNKRDNMHLYVNL